MSEIGGWLADEIVAKEIDYIVYVNTGWQALGANAKINKYPENSNGLIIIPDFSLDKRTDPDSFSPPSSHHVKVIVLSGIAEAPKHKRIPEHLSRIIKYNSINKSTKTNGRKIDLITKYSYMSNFNHAFAHKRVKDRYYPRYILVDPGYEEYIPDSMHGKTMLRRTYEKLEHFISNKFYRDIQIVRRNLFTIEDNSLVHNRDILLDYKSVTPTPNSLSQNSILLLTQPNNSLQISDESWLNAIDKFCEDLIEEGYEIVLKKHPSEKVEKYFNLNVSSELHYVRRKIDAEELIREVSPANAIGFTTTSLLTLNVLYGINSYTFALSDKYNVESENQEVEKMFVQLTKNYVDSVDNLF